MRVSLRCVAMYPWGNWSDGLAATGPNYYMGIVKNLDETLEAHKQETKCCFGTRSSVHKKLDVRTTISILGIAKQL